ncbi:MAG: NUDIX domain-containing protein [Novosphingobium sp.]|nr:NUDIX domain-containing protein [Novosphingobium sp.]
MTQSPARRIRRAARVVLLGPGAHVLLFRYTADGFDPFWILPGGECDPEEEFAQAAARELHEETGIRAKPAPLDHVVEAEYDYLGEPVKSLEHFFHHRTASSEIDTSGHTALERRVMRTHRWFAAGELAGWDETIYPLNLPLLLARIAERN